jgi:glycosyltransferase involved in cell wall biosynthesis
MRIAISTLVTPSQKSGIGNYVVNLIHALQEVDTENSYFILIGSDTRYLFPLHAPNFIPVYLPFGHDPRWLMRPTYYAWQNTLAGMLLRKRIIDVLHLPNLLPLFVRFVPTVVTIPDLSERKVAKYGRLRQAYRSAIVPFIARRASRLVTISENSKQELVGLGYAPASRIDVTYLASAISTAPPADPEAMDRLRHKHGLADDYVLYVGKLLAHKNLERLIEAFALLRRRHAIPHHLVLAGPPQGDVERLVHVAEQRGVTDRVHLLGYVADEELPLLYAGAAVFAFPSLSEGFGLPVLEAMACGTPVVTSNTSSLPEVAGDAAVLVDPVSIEAIADGIWSVLADDPLRRSLVAKGVERAARFTWQRCAEQTLEAYRRTVDNSQSGTGLAI